MGDVGRPATGRPGEPGATGRTGETGGSSEAGGQPATGGWVADPGTDDEVVRERTGRGWDEWRARIDAWPRHADGHAAVARWIEEEHGVDGWWAQQVTVGWERISGRRLPNQLADGTFTAGRSATLAVDAEALKTRLLDDEQRASLFPDHTTELRSRPTSKNVRLAFDEGVAEVAMAPKPDGRVTLTIQHQKLPSPEAVTRWKAFWGDWLTGLHEA